MTGIGRWTVLIGLALSLTLAPASSWAGPLGDFPGGADPAKRLTPAQRAAAKALGEARREVAAGRYDAARSALDRVGAGSSLEGYAELVRGHLLVREGAHAKAHRLATQALTRFQGDALRAAFGVLQGEALAMAGDDAAAELAFREVLATPAAEDVTVRQSIELAIVSARQRTGSLDPGVDPLVLLDQHDDETLVSTSEVPIELLSPSAVLEKAAAALDRGHPDRALELYDHVIAKPLDPSLARRAKLGRARALFRERKYKGAIAAYGALLPDLEARFWRARSLARDGQIEASLVEFDEVARGSDEELASWALYLKGTLHEDRGEMEQAIGAFKRAARYERFPERARSALWREGWAQYRTGRYADARRSFAALAEKTDDALSRLRPRYWAARAATADGQAKTGSGELRELAREFPLTYYGWRAQERLALDTAGLIVTRGGLAEGTQQVDDRAIERAALLIEAGLEDLARDELRFAAREARGFVDRTRVGILLAKVGDYHRANELVVTAYDDSLARGLQPGREALWWLSWPPAYRDTIAAVLPENPSIEPELVWAIMREESHYRVDARSAVGAIGLLQLMPTTAAEIARKNGMKGFETEDLFDPTTNITLGATYLDQLGARFDGRMSAAIGSYNAGAYRVSTWLRGDAAALEDDVWVENIPYDQTRAYVKRVLRSMQAYRVLY